jgi:hypothetical protein
MEQNETFFKPGFFGVFRPGTLRPAIQEKLIVLLRFYPCFVVLPRLKGSGDGEGRKFRPARPQPKMAASS